MVNNTERGCSRSSLGPPLQGELALVELTEVEADLGAVLCPPHPDGLGPDGGDGGAVAVVLALHPDRLTASEPALLIEQLPVLDPGLDPRGRGRAEADSALELLLDRARGRAEAECLVDDLDVIVDLLVLQQVLQGGRRLLPSLLLESVPAERVAQTVVDSPAQLPRGHRLELQRVPGELHARPLDLDLLLLLLQLAQQLLLEVDLLLLELLDDVFLLGDEVLLHHLHLEVPNDLDDVLRLFVGHVELPDPLVEVGVRQLRQLCQLLLVASQLLQVHLLLQLA